MNTLVTRARRSRFFRIGTLMLVVTALGLPVAASASSGASSQAKAQTAFRKEFVTYLTQMQEVALMVRTSPQGRAALNRIGVNPTTGFTRARREVLRMSPDQLAVLQEAFAAVPDWQKQPRVLKSALRRNGFSPTGRSRTLAVPATCDPGPGTPMGITDFYIAAGVALGLETAHEAIPDDILTSPAQIAAAIAWGAAAAAALTLEGLNAVEAECLAAKFEDFTRTQLDAKISTRATQVSVDAFTSSFNAFNTSFNSFLTSFNGLSSLINTRLDVVVSTRASQSSLTTFHDEFTANAAVVNTKLDGITSSLASVHSKIDSLTVTVGDQGKLALRMQIEADLSDPGNHPVALFGVPASAGGYLGVTREIVVDIIAKMTATGQGVGNAQAFLASGDAAAAAGDYKGAYTEYGKAYRAAATR
jgi:hypothetical protein